jgi:hypothetical protein
MSESELKKSGYPNFASVSEEEAYWTKEHAEIEARALAAFRDGTVRRRHSSLQLDPKDARQAEVLAAQRGVEYQVFVKKLVHDALERELSTAK